MSEPASTKPLSMGGDFSAANRADWRKLVDGVLKGASFEDRLVSTTYDGIDIEPLYSLSDMAGGHISALAGLTGATPAVDAPPWQILAAISHPDREQANKAILAELSGGASGIVLKVADGADAPGIGLWTLDDLERTLGDVHLDMVGLYLDGGARGAALASLMMELWEKRATAANTYSGGLGLDPLTVLARTGALAGGMAGWTGLLGDAIGFCEATGSPLRAITASGRSVHEAGGTPAQELAAALASALDYLRLLDGGGVALDVAARQIRFALSAGADLFTTTARLRAMRLIWARACQACGLEPQSAVIDAQTSGRIMTARDPWVNMLRTTVACFAAGAGGADTITVQPYTAALGNPDPFASRIARNVHLVLQEESAIGRVRDPAAGSWYVETLTRQLAETAWTLFQDIEAQGGMAAALTGGHVQGLVADVRDQRASDIATRKRVLVGVSEFANRDENDIATPDWPAATAPDSAEIAPGASLDDLRQVARDGAMPAFKLSGETVCAPLRPIRLGAPFEALRDAAAAHETTTGTAPRVFIVTLGAPSDHAGRSRFARDLFAAGGIDTFTVDHDLANREDAARAFVDSGAVVAVMCSSDRIYETLGVEVVAALASAGAAHICLCGNPSNRDDLKNAGVTAFAYVGCDVLEILQQTHAVLGVGQ